MSTCLIQSRDLRNFGAAVGFRENGPEKAATAQKKAVVLGPAESGGLSGMKISTADMPKLFHRTGDNTTNPRLRFLKSVLDEFGVKYKSDDTVGDLKALAKKTLPKGVQDVMKFEDYDTFFKHPLSDYRVTTVLRAITTEKMARSVVLDDLKKGLGHDKYGQALKNAFGMASLKWDDFFSVNDDYSDFVTWLSVNGDSVRHDSHATDIESFIADLALRFAFSRSQDQAAKMKENETQQIKNFAKGSVPQTLDDNVRSVVLDDLQKGLGYDIYGQALKNAFEKANLKCDDFFSVNDDYGDFVTWLSVQGDSVRHDSQATDIEAFITDLALCFASSRKQSPVGGSLKSDLRQSVFQGQAAATKRNPVEVLQIRNLAKKGNVPPNNEYLGDGRCGEETSDRKVFNRPNGNDWSIFDAETNTTRKFYTYQQGGGAQNNCLFLSVLRHLNITPTNENAQLLRKTMDEVFQQLKQAVGPKLLAAKVQLEQQRGGYTQEQTNLGKREAELRDKKTAQGDEQKAIETELKNIGARLNKINNELADIETGLEFIQSQLETMSQEDIKNGNGLTGTCPVSFEAGDMVIADKDDPAIKLVLTELFKAERPTGGKVLKERSYEMADVAHAALLPLMLKRPVIVVTVDTASKDRVDKSNPENADDVLDGRFTKFTKNILTGEDYGDREPVYIRFAKDFRSPGDTGHFEAMVPVLGGSTQEADQNIELYRQLELDWKKIGFLEKSYIEKEVKHVFHSQLPSNGWERYLKLQALNRELAKDTTTKKGINRKTLRDELKAKLAQVAENIQKCVNSVKDEKGKSVSLQEDLNTWLVGFCKRALTLVEPAEQPKKS